MKANELMIGDWVMVDMTYPSMGKKKPRQVTLQDLICVEQGIDVEPIPLTAEILEKNGWKWDNTRGEYVSSTFSLEWDIDLREVWLRIGGEFIIINYVHELQHALRLCGLNELADNFRI